MAKINKCPICGKTTDEKYRPFCCKRCSNVDLGKWLGESYTIPVVEIDTEDLEIEDSDEASN